MTPKKFRAWLKTIPLNCWRQQQRKRIAEKRKAGVHLDQLAAPDELGEFEEDEYRRRLVRRALALMQAEFQTVTWKACWEFVDQREALEKTAVSGAALREKLADFPCQVLLLLDAYHSGSFGAGALAGYKSRLAKERLNGLASLSLSHGLQSARAVRTAYHQHSSPKASHPISTWHASHGSTELSATSRIP